MCGTELPHARMSKNATEGRVFANGRVFFGETRPPARKQAFAAEGRFLVWKRVFFLGEEKSRASVYLSCAEKDSESRKTLNPAVSALQKSRNSTAELMKTQIPLYPRCKNPENIQRNSRNPKSRCILAAKTPKTYSGIQENSNPAVSPLQKSRKHTAEFKKSQIPRYSHGSSAVF